MPNITANDYQQTLLALLRQHAVFAAFSEADLETFAQCARIGGCQVGQKIILQGDSRQQFFLVLDGQLRAMDVSRETPRLLNEHPAGEFIGLRTLLHQRPRAATVEATTDSVVALFNKAAWDWLWAVHPEVIDYFREVEAGYEQRNQATFPGQQSDERVIIAVKRHIITVLPKMARSAVWLVAPILVLVLQSLTQESVVASILNHWLVSLLGTLPFIIVTLFLWLYHYLDWRNDDFIVTNKRVIHIERILFYGEERHEAPLPHVQDVTILTSGFISEVVDCSDVSITTAGVGVIRLTGIPDAEAVKEAILLERQEVMTRLKAADSVAIRHSLAQRLNLADTVNLPKPTDLPLTPPPPEIPQITPLPAAIRWLTYLIPRTKTITQDTTGEPAIVWRRHYGILLLAVIWPLLLFLTSGYLLTASLLGLPPLSFWPDWWVRLPLSLLTLASAAWYLWQYDGWQRDVYIVTPTRIVDVESSNFRLKGETRREARFDTIQNITYDIPNLWSKLFNVGDVVIETAGSRETFTFKQVFNPSGVQQEVFRRMVHHQQRRKQQEHEANTDQFIDMLGEYHQLFEQLRPA